MLASLHSFSCFSQGETTRRVNSSYRVFLPFPCTSLRRGQRRGQALEDEVHSVFAAMSEASRQIVDTPFKLWLLEQLVQSGNQTETLTGMRSEVELLEAFWGYRVTGESNGEEREILLAHLLRVMTREERLAVTIETVGTSNKALRPLLSSEVLAHGASAGNLLRFSHNILFDFAASKLLLDDSAIGISSFLSNEPSLAAVFLRPSVDYVFVRLWYSRRDEFWESYMTIQASEGRVRLFARLIPASVVAREALNTSDLDPLIENQSTQAPARDALDWVLRGRVAMEEIGRPGLWSQVLETISRNPHEDFAFTVALLVGKILESDDLIDPGIRSRCGLAARSILNWVWENRSAQPALDQLGAYWGVVLVAQTFETDVTASRSRLNQS